MLSNLISAMPAWMKGLSAKIYFLVFLAVVGIGAITLQASLNSKSDLEASKAEELHHLVQTALSVIETFDEQAKAGQISEQEAKTRAMSLLSRMRYNDTDYFWINDMNRIMLMHGTDPSNVGKDFTEITDPNGTYVFQELVRIGQQENGGMLRYEWPHPQSRQPVMKMSYVQSYKDWGWIVGTGAYIDELQANLQTRVMHLLSSGFIIFVVIALISALIALSITRPIMRLVQSMLELAQGHLDVDIAHCDREDEIGSMNRAMVIFRDNARQRIQLEEQQSLKEAQAEAEKCRMMLDIAAEFDQTVRTIIDQVRHSSVELGKETNGLASRSRENTDRLQSVYSAMEEASSNVGTVANASEEMSASIIEISGQMSESTQVAHSAFEEVQKANEVMSTLNDASSAIGHIVGLIQEIAGQTNLLALNATIEAARAGDAGKGFAVVAVEVKDLALQTGKATEEISGQINAIQSNIADAIHAIGRLENTIDKMTAISSTIAAAVEEQGIAAGEISSNIVQAAAGSRDASENASMMGQIASKNSEGAEVMSNNAQALQDQIENLAIQVDQFLQSIYKQTQKATSEAA